MHPLLLRPSEVLTVMGMKPMHEVCEWCKGPVRVMCQKGTGVCSQQCAKLASKILFDSKEKADKFKGGYSGDDDRHFPPAA